MPRVPVEGAGGGDEPARVFVAQKALVFSSGLSMKIWEVALAMAVVFALILWLVLHHIGASPRRQSSPIIDPASN
jgi:hypothetical protein